MNQGRQQPVTKTLAPKLSILLIDANSERRALRKKIMATHGVEVIGASDVTEAGAIWQRDRYDMVLIDIRADHRGCLAFRDEIKKDSAGQIVAFLVGRPKFIDLEPLLGSYIAEAHGSQWGDSMRKAVRESCDSLLQRNGLVEATWRIAAGRKMNGTPHNVLESSVPAISPLDFIADSLDA
ncbi:MAG TPA: response regulator [Candidatus Limnocylindrales bacterium]|nr:response regulator [Candidatus Limnocylindrales bacterium]